MSDLKALFKVEYGLYVITTNDGRKDNGFICNSVLQISSNPTYVAVSINKANYTHDTVLKTKKMNVCPIVEDASFSLFKRFGFQSGKDTNKFEGFHAERSENGLLYLDEFANSYLSLNVVNTIDYPSHTLFICEIEDAKVLNDYPTMSYGYYHKNVKPKPEKKAEPKKPGMKKWVCTICGYVYEGTELPADFICPICKHPASDFEEVKE